MPVATNRPKDETTKRLESNPLTKKGSDISAATTSLMRYQSAQLARIQETVQTGQFTKEAQRLSEEICLQGLETLQASLPLLKPEHMPKAIESTYAMSQALSGKPSSLSASLHVSLDGKDLSRDDLIKMIKPIPASKARNPESPTSIETTKTTTSD